MTGRPAARVWFLFPVALAGCLGPLDNSSTVHDLRILAIATDPPELRYPIAPVDAGSAEQELLLELAGFCIPDLYPLEAQPTLTLKALVGDPQGKGRSLHFVFTGCPPTGTERCPDGGAYTLGEGDAPAPELSVDWQFSTYVAAELMAQGAGPGTAGPEPLIETLEGSRSDLCRLGVWFQIGLEIDASDGEQLFGSKLLVFTPVPPDYAAAASCPSGPPPHENPVLADFSLDGEALPLDSVPQVSASVQHTLRPREPSDGPQPYCVAAYDGSWVPQQETWLFSAMTDVGSFNREMVGGAGSVLSDQTGPSTDLNFTWDIPEDGGVGKIANLYEITRDGRGGTSWIVRQAQIIP